MATTPIKSGISGKEDITSPSAKRALDYDFWTERTSKMPKIVEEDIKDWKIKDLAVSKRIDGQVRLYCSAICDLSKVFKLSCHDGENSTTVTAFGSSGNRLKKIRVNDSFFLGNFEVKKENPAYPTGTFQDMELVFSDYSTLQMIDGNSDTTPMPYILKTISEIKELPDSTVVDALAVVAKNWDVTTTSTGKEKLDVSLTDKTKETIRFTLWEKSADQLVGIEHEVAAISRASVTSFQGVKMLTCKWHTKIEVNPKSDAADDLLKWFEQEIQQ